MKCVKISNSDIYGISTESFSDERGIFTRILDLSSLPNNFNWNQISYSVNPKPYTLRGLHFQTGASSESKIVMCVNGAAQDVLVDIRESKISYLEHYSFKIGPNEELQGLYIPNGFAHGFLTLESQTSLIYFIDHEYNPDAADGLNWRDPKLNIDWLAEPLVISKNDSNRPYL